MAQIIINGKEFQGSRLNITNNNQSIRIDGDNIFIGDERVINISVVGDVEEIEAGSADVKITGSVGKARTGSGDIVVNGNVLGDLTTGSGDVSCGNIGGSVRTGSGDIIYKK
jgi:hypothetical protein